uniref:Uncharacterized protein n=1 Tax=Vespula pensylvanica TaxID=30213 RepID=A0A834KJE6_VESPE|nr:hypothetical protein H0235_013941 [Vespula pensylvanica]
MRHCSRNNTDGNSNDKDNDDDNSNKEKNTTKEKEEEEEEEETEKYEEEAQSNTNQCLKKSRKIVAIFLRLGQKGVRFEQRTMDEKGYEEYTKMLLDVASSYIQHEVSRARAHPNYTRFGRDLEPLFPHQFRSYPNRGVECTTIVITTTNTNAITNTNTTTLIPATSLLLTP